MNVVLREVKYPKVKEYIREQLGTSSEFLSLSKYLLELYNVEHGRLSIIVPSNLEQQRLLDLDWGELLPLSGPQQCLANLILDYLDSSHKCVVFEDAMLRPRNQSKLFETFPEQARIMHTFGEEVYFLVKQGTLEEEQIRQLISSTNYTWHFLCVMTSLEKNNLFDERLSEDVLRELAVRVKTIVFTVYDGESYLIWEVKEQT